MATHSGILAWRIPWTEVPGGLWSLKESDTTEQLILYIYIFFFLPLCTACGISVPRPETELALSSQLSTHALALKAWNPNRGH